MSGHHAAVRYTKWVIHVTSTPTPVKAYYQKAERIQTEHRLADGCTADEYAKKALSFILHPKPVSRQRRTLWTTSRFNHLVRPAVVGAVSPW